LLKSSFRPFKDLSGVIPDERELMSLIDGLIMQSEKSKVKGNSHDEP
jgi:hypothetical protein